MPVLPDAQLPVPQLAFQFSVPHHHHHHHAQQSASRPVSQHAHHHAAESKFQFEHFHPKNERINSAVWLERKQIRTIFCTSWRRSKLVSAVGDNDFEHYCVLIFLSAFSLIINDWKYFPK